MRVSAIINKYTNEHLSEDDLQALGSDASQPVIARLTSTLLGIADDIRFSDQELTRLADSITKDMAKVNRAIAAGADDHVMPINPFGELQANGPRFDVLIAVRAEQIRQLRMLTGLLSAHLKQQHDAR